MTTRSWTPAGIAVSCERTTSLQKGWRRPACLALLGALLLLAAPAQAQTLGNFCPIGTCDITNPHYVNVYWDSSLAQWDIDVAANSTQMTHDHIDHLTEALIHSEYFVNNTQFGDGALNQYSVTTATLGPSLATGGCGAAPATLDKAHDAIQNLVICFLQNNPNLKASNLILNLFVPPQSMAAPGYCMGKGSEAGDHGQYYGPNFLVDPTVEVSFLPTTAACHGDLPGLFVTVTHEMVEATTDPNYKSPTGWKDGTPGDFYGQEAGDLCESTKFAAVMFLYGSASTYWSDLSAKCSSGYPLSVPQVSKTTACGAGQNMSITLTGFFGPMPWDLASNKFGKQTLYLNLLVDHGGKVWEAGNFEGLPPNNDFNPNGKPDVVNFGAGGVSWSQNSITISGFDNNYGKTMGNGAVAEVAPGDQIIVNLALQESGQFFKTKVFNAPAASQILNLAVTPKGGDPYIFVNRQADVSGSAADAGNCAVQKQWVTLMGWQGMVNPGMVSTSSSGQFQSLYTAPAVAGTQKVNANLASNNSVMASVPVPVHPVLNSITPNVGPVAGGQSATLAGDGFDPGNTTVGFSGAAAQVGNVTLNSIAVVTPKSPLGGDGDGTADVIATVNGLDSLAVPYQYVLPGKPYISFKSTDCKTHYIVVTVYDDQAKPIVVPIHLTAGYAAYMSNGQWVASMNTNSGVWVQVDKGGPFTATNLNKNLSNTASFPVLPEGICDNVKLITKVDWHIFEKPGDLRPEEINQLNPGERVNVGGKKVVVWTRAANVKDATTYVLDPAGTAGGGGLRVSTVGAEQFRGILHGSIFLGGGGMKTESAPGQPTANIREVQFAGPAFSIVRAGQRADAVASLGRTLRLSFDLPQGNSNPHSFHIVHLIMLDGQPTWVEDGGTQLLAYKSAITRTIDQSGIYALLEVVGSASESAPQQREQKQEQRQQPPQRQEPPAQPQPAPPGSTVLVPDGAFPGGVLTGVVLGPDDKPVPNTPVNIAGGVPITLTGVVIGEEPTPPQPQPCQPDPTTGQLPPGCQPPPPPPCQPDAAGNLPPGCQPPPQQPCQPDPTTGLMPAGCAPPTVNQPSDCASVLRRFKALPAGQAGPGAAAPGQTGASPTAVEAVGGPSLHTDANGRFAMCIPVDAPKVTVSLTGAKGVVIQGGEVPQKPGAGVVIQGGTVAEVPVLSGTPALPAAPPSFFQPSQKISIIGVLRKPTMEQGGRTWLLPAVNAISPNGQQTISAFQTPRDLQPGPVDLSYTGGDGQTHQVQGGVFRILRATLDRSKLRSQEGADFEYTVQFGDSSVRACVNVTVAGPVVLMQAPPPQIPLDASGIGHFGGKIRATQVAPGAAIPFDIKPDIHLCGQ